jgi:ABC-type glycerol-3-phosphate transport system substrate-binding protein
MSARILASLVAAFAIGAAASSGPAAGAEPLQVWSYLRADTASKDVKERAVGDIVQAFKTANPGMDVAVTVMPWQQLSPSLLRASKSGQVPDVVMLFSPSVQMQIAAGTLISLQPYLDKWPQDAKSDLVHLSQNVSPKGGTYAVPWQLRVSGLMYRDDLLKAAGKQPPRTLDELASLAQTLPKDGNVGLAMGFSPEAPSVAAGWFLTSVTGSGGKILNDDGSAAFDSPQAERLAKWARDLVHSGKDAWPLNVALQGQEQAYSLFSAKRSVFFAMSSDRLDNVRQKTQLGKDIKMISYPGFACAGSELEFRHSQGGAQRRRSLEIHRDLHFAGTADQPGQAGRLCARAPQLAQGCMVQEPRGAEHRLGRRLRRDVSTRAPVPREH